MYIDVDGEVHVDLDIHVPVGVHGDAHVNVDVPVDGHVQGDANFPHISLVTWLHMLM